MQQTYDGIISSQLQQLTTCVKSKYSLKKKIIFHKLNQ